MVSDYRKWNKKTEITVIIAVVIRMVWALENTSLRIFNLLSEEYLCWFDIHIKPQLLRSTAFKTHAKCSLSGETAYCSLQNAWRLLTLNNKKKKLVSMCTVALGSVFYVEGLQRKCLCPWFCISVIARETGIWGRALSGMARQNSHPLNFSKYE